jgi:hypothetical protein
VARLQPKPGQESWREQRGMGARGAIDLHEVAQPEILDPDGIQWGHLPPDVLCSFHRLDHHEQGRIVNPRAAPTTKLAEKEKAEVAASGGAADNGVFAKS